MVYVTPANENYRYTNQDCDEQQALLTDLFANPRDYLAHADGQVRCYGYWAKRERGGPELIRLHKELRKLA